ncbi:DUF2066 domain-containing protein [Salinisphaera sp. P385]|uniref:DUF2066 domain-containing protein n=1 Tax=Spectribacter acetivorans TaxID=3075603 RepID=A0ABU3BA92_9GAMM|nr:DUF2066 domain-containing protein [Salinisphaera sp. P385]MDT0619391.1 DUF2066 domain-containing protein [Salinisphaera sp. P385]
MPSSMMPLFRLLPLVVCLLFALPAAAVEVADLYGAEVEAADQSEQTREGALRQALGLVLVRVTGDRAVTERSGAAGILERADELVQQYGYQGSDASGVTLRVSFEPTAVNEALRDAGIAVWGRERPATMPWVAMAADGLLTEATPADGIEAMRDAARNRGLPLQLPRTGEAERGRVTPADIASGNDARLMSVARGYGTANLLVGRIGSEGGSWGGRWRLLSDGTELANWQGAADSRPALLAEALHRVADIYARTYAARAGARSTTASGGGSGGTGAVGAFDAGDDGVLVAISNVAGASDYNRVAAHLADIGVVEWLSPALVREDMVLFRVKVTGGSGVLDRNIDLADWLRRDSDATRQAEGLTRGGAALGYRLSR